MSSHARSFDHAAALYAAARPEYPSAALRWLLPDRADRVLDLGAGTGKLTAQLAARGLDVIAVEPSPQMLDELRRALPEVPAHEAPAEAIPLPDADVDVVLVGQAFHWFDAEPALREIARVLRPGGVLGLVWNSYDDRVDWVARLADVTHNAARASLRDPQIPYLPELYGPGETHEVENVQRLTRAGLLDLVRTHSHYLMVDEAEQAELVAGVEALLAEHPDLAGRDDVDLPYSTLCWRATRR